MNHRIIMTDYAGGHSAGAGIRGEIYDRRRLADLIRLLRDVGFDTMWFRTSYCGTVCYHSKVMKPFQAEYRIGIGQALRSAMAQFDPLEVAVEESRRCGLKVLAWISPMDTYYPGMEDPWLASHPEWLLRSRDGQHAMRGLPCFACRDYVDRRVEEVREVMQFGCDGVYHAWGTHTIDVAAGSDPPDLPDNFGWNPEILDEYHRRHGKPGTADDYEKPLVWKIHADHLGDFVRRCGEIVHQSGGEYVTSNCGGVLTTDDYSYFLYRPGGARVFWLPARWREWGEEKWIDRVVPTADGWCQAENEKITDSPVPMIGLMHTAWHGDPALVDEGQSNTIARAERCLRRWGAVALQESDSIEWSEPQLWEALRAMFARVNGRE